LPQYDVTLALGAWKFAHWLLPGRSMMGTQRLVLIGVSGIVGAARGVVRPRFSDPSGDAHKYTRGLVAIVGGAMPGAAELAATSAMRGGAGYVKLLSDNAVKPADPGLVIENDTLEEALLDERISALLVGPGLGRGDQAIHRLSATLKVGTPTLLDADALIALRPDMIADNSTILATPHDGELTALCRNFAVVAETRQDRAMALARTSGMVVMAKGPDTIIAAPDGRLAITPPATSWLSIAGTGDVLAGIAVSRMATGADPFEAACEAVWLHGEAARICNAPFTPLELAKSVSLAMARCR